MHKGKGFLSRLRCAIEGIRAAFRHESSFRIQLLAAFFALFSLFLFHPPLYWTALFAVMIFLVLAAELFNTALEHLLDGLHPENAEFVRIAKDCSAAAVLLLSIASVLVFIFMVISVWA
ncbi:MAG TPA: diacylglycerol kinase [Burkholderiales bacterium]|nr:diacylglycerol kinase [Burkholderiales bacterium]